MFFLQTKMDSLQVLNLLKMGGRYFNQNFMLKSNPDLLKVKRNLYSNAIGFYKQPFNLVLLIIRKLE